VIAAVLTQKLIINFSSLFISTAGIFLPLR